MKVLELFSGIGGMHLALKEIKIDIEVTAVEINTTANYVYKHNFPKTKLLQRNIQSFTIEEINALEPEMIVMSPPCQPFTRVGLKRDISDERSCALSHIISLLPAVHTLKYILVENVKGFEMSIARDKLVECLNQISFDYQELMLSPVQFGIANVRLRYYLIGKRKPEKLCLPKNGMIMEYIPQNILDGICSALNVSRTIGDILAEPVSSDDYLIPDKVLSKYAWILDIVTRDSTKSCCFTKAYGHYVEGTGSVFCPYADDQVKLVFEQYKYSNDLDIIKGLKLRYFCAEEILRLMCFPTDFSFPNNITRKQKYRLLGNSINVKVVALLLRILLFDGNT